MMVNVIGLGLAGAWCSYGLMQRGFTVHAYDVPKPNSSTRIAAGLITPITGQRVKPSWLFAELFTECISAYAEVEKQMTSKLNVQVALLQRVTLKRIFKNEEQHQYYQKRIEKNELSNIHNEAVAPGVYNGIHFPFGGFITRDAAVVNLPLFLDCIEKLIVFSGGRIERSQPPLGQTETPTITCTGYQIIHNELWNWLPVETSKGEILDARCQGVELDYVINSGTWVVPLADGTIRIGATNDWDDVTEAITDKARILLLNDSESILGGPVTVINHRAGIRPSTGNKRPIAGSHPVLEGQFVCTGFGAKGTLVAPWVSNQLLGHIFDGMQLHQEIDAKQWWPGRNNV